MAKQQGGINKSQAIRELLRKNPKMPVKDVLATLGGQGIKVHANLVYFVKGRMKGRKGRGQQVRQPEASVVAPSVNGDPLSTILRVKRLAAEVGGMRKLRALVEALSD